MCLALNPDAIVKDRREVYVEVMKMLNAAKLLPEYAIIFDGQNYNMAERRLALANLVERAQNELLDAYIRDTPGSYEAAQRKLKESILSMT